MTIEDALATPARSYCRIIAKEIKVLESLLKSYKCFGDDVSEGSRKLLIELSKEADEDCEKYTPSLIDYINLCGMEISVLAQRTSGVTGWNIIGIRLLKTDGGTYDTIDWLNSDYVEVKVHWAGDSALPSSHWSTSHC